MVFSPGVPFLGALVEPNWFGRRVVDHVPLEQVAFATLVDEYPVIGSPLRKLAALGIVKMVAPDDRAGLETECVEAAAVAETIHHVKDVVVLDKVLLAGRRIGVPLPAHRNPAIGQVVYQIV